MPILMNCKFTSFDTSIAMPILQIWTWLNDSCVYHDRIAAAGNRSRGELFRSNLAQNTLVLSREITNKSMPINNNVYMLLKDLLEMIPIMQKLVSLLKLKIEGCVHGKAFEIVD